MTRVEKINIAIKYLFVNKGLKLREIQKELLLYDIELDMAELIAIVGEFGLKQVVPRKKSRHQELRALFEPLLDALLKIASDFRITNRELCAYLNFREINYPSKGPFTKNTLETIISSYGIKYPRTNGTTKSNFSSQEVINQTIENNLSPKVKKMIEDWKKKNVKKPARDIDQRGHLAPSRKRDNSSSQK